MGALAPSAFGAGKIWSGYVIRTRFRNPSFDIAPKAPRYTAAAWKTLGAGMLFLLVCSWPLLRTIQELKRLQSAQDQTQAQQRLRAKAQRAELARMNEPAALEKIKAQQRIQQMVRMSWFGLFDALEAATQEVRGGVSLLSLTPTQAQAEQTQVRLTALAANAPLMLEYLRALRKDPRIIAAELTSQQTDDNAGPGVIRMQLTVLWNPQAILPQQQAAPHGTSEAPGLVADGNVARPPVARVVVKEAAR